MYSFVEITNGYKYRLIEAVTCDENICTATFEVEKNGKETENIVEINTYIPELISAIMENNFKEKHIAYDLNGKLYHIQNNVYELVWEINERRDIYKLLKQFCEGKEIIILSDEFKNKKCVYQVEQKGFIIKRIVEIAIIEEQKLHLKKLEFVFKDDYVQMTYEEVKKIR